MPNTYKFLGAFEQISKMLCFIVVTNSILCGLTYAAEGAKSRSSGESYSPSLRQGFTRLFWGDTHLHSSLSADAFQMGTRLRPEDSFRFARGEKITTESGLQVRLQRPLDFVAVSDHAEYMGVLSALKNRDPILQRWPFGRRWQRLHDKGDEEMPDGWTFANALQSKNRDIQPPAIIRKSIWNEVVRTADQYNVPGLFTAFVAYEWSALVTGDNLHRVVLFRDGANLAGQILPFSAQQSTDPEDLWMALSDYEKKTGGQAMAIAHNGNLSNGRMFSPYRQSGEPLDTTYARLRSRWEPVYEVSQIKGDSETHPNLSPGDEFADFETWDDGNISLTAPKQKDMLQYEYARSALREGLRHEKKIGVNPFKFGLIGSTDSHTALSTTQENNFFGKFVGSAPSEDRVYKKMAGKLQEGWHLSASGLVGVWAKENTRASLFDAIKRREVFATTGSRIQVRFFGGWSFDTKDIHHHDFAFEGYRKGVPMGGDLTGEQQDDVPHFMVAAAKDPDGANLDRLQIIKGWLSASGETYEKVYDVALSDSRSVSARTGKAPAVGSTVELDNASYSNEIGAAQLSTVWIDPEFDPEEPAFYYARVIEIPTPRWTAYDANYFDITLPKRATTIIQDRAYTSPIWYTP